MEQQANEHQADQIDHETGETGFMQSLDIAEAPIRIDVPPANPAPPVVHTRQNYRCGGIGLALGGGAARGWAHIGVLRAFDEVGVKVSMIAGTSIGALVGGCYLSGNLDHLEEFARSITRTNMLRYMDFTLRGSGLISGERLANKMSEHLDNIWIEQMDRPFVAIAADISTGNEIWLHDGPLTKAIRCSYALPGVFQPVENGGKLLVDGAIVNPVPVSACRAYEPDVVIAINLNSEVFGKGTVIRASAHESVDEQNTDPIENNESSDENSQNSSWFRRLGAGKKNRHLRNKQLGVTGVMTEAFNIIQDRIARTRLAGDPPDYTIRPLLKGMGLTDFHRAEEAIELGYQEGMHRLRELDRQQILAAYA